jgi:hypothetical protein
MVTKHLKRCPTLYIVMKIQIETSIRYCYSPIRLNLKEKKKKLVISNLGKGTEHRQFSYIARREAKWHSHFGKTIGIFL